MRIGSATLRTFKSVHNWVGITAGFLLFVAFYAGAITVFQQPIQRWASMRDARAVAAPASLSDAQRLLDEVLAGHPHARDFVGMTFPGSEYATMSAYWQDAQGTWRYATAGDTAGSPAPPGAVLPELINELHYALGAPPLGTWLMGVVSLLYGIALISGLIIHLPMLVRNLFALRPGRNLKQFWQDAHNVIGVLSLPFHLVFAVTGAALCLLAVAMVVLNPLVFDGKLNSAVGAAMDTAPVMAPASREGSLLPLADLYRRSIDVAKDHGVADFRPAYLKLTNAGDAHAVIEITGTWPRGLGAGVVALDATSGAMLAQQLPGQRDANHLTLAATYALHYGDYGNAIVQWLYFLLGLGGAFLFYSGNLLWIESRRKRSRRQQGRAPTNMARATVGICLGLCVAVSLSFVAAQVLPLAGINGGRAEYAVCFGAWALCALWAARRAPIRAARELLWLAAAVTAVIPVAHGLATGWWFWISTAAGQYALSGVDLVALAMGLAFAMLARAVARRGHRGDPYSVWADDAAVDGTPGTVAS
ncbi:MAG TPA: PepSY-associated TM helix domain-containing protein [Rhodanobacteraceae bacterium]